MKHRAIAAALAGAIVVAGGLGCPLFSQTAPLKLAEYFNDPYRLDDDAGSLQELIDRLLDGGFPMMPGLSSPSSRATHEEILLRRIRDQIGSTGRYRDAIEPLLRFLESEHDPNVEALARSHLGFCQWHVGDLEGAQDSWRRMSFLSDWMLVGPFENERGSGFGSATEVETDLDLTRDYVGKRNRVAWRRVSGDGRGGMVEIGQLVRPNEEALAYLLTHIEVEAPIDVVLRIGSTGACSVTVGSQDVLRRDVERRLSFDQDAVCLRLGKGWHRVLVKVGNTKGAWAFRARFTDLEGRPVALRIDAQPPPESALGSQVAVLDVPPSLGAVTLLADAEPTAEVLTLRGYVESDRAAHDLNRHPDRILFRQAVEKSDSAIPSYLFAETLARDVTHSAEREENRWRRAVEQTLERDPGFDRACLDLATYYDQRFGNHTKAVEFVSPLLERAEPPARALVLAARIARARLGSVAAVDYETRHRERLLSSAPAPSLRRAEASNLRQQGRIDEAEALLRAGLEFDSVQLDLRRALADLRVARGDLDGARAILEFLTLAYPQHAGPHRSIAGLEASRDRLDAALAAIDAAIVLAPQDASLHRLRGDYLMRSGQSQPAALAFRVALELEPNQPRLREYVDLQAASESRFGDEHRIDAAPVIAEALIATEAENVTHRVLIDNTAVHIQQDGRTQRFQQFVAKIVNDQGIRSFDYYPVNYAYGEQWVEVTRARVHHADGRTEDARIRNRDPAVREGEYPVWSTAWVDLPTLEVGDVIEIEYRQEDLRQSFFGDYFGDRILFGDRVPIERRVYTIVAPSDKELFFHSRGVEIEPDISESSGHKVWRWEARELAKIDPEAGMPPMVELAPVLEVSTFATWDDFSQWYYHLIRKQFESSEEIRVKVAELTSGLATPAEKIRAIYDFVVTDVRYIAWEFGVHGFKPYNASTIFTRRFGDCKDKATLICTMLDEIGIDAHPVLIYGDRARAKEDLALPLVLHFNHCIAYIPDVGDGTGLFVDGTAENHSVSQLPMMDRGARVLIVRDDGGEIADIPWNRPEEQGVVENVKIEIAADGSARIQQTNRLTGDFGVSIRSALEIEGQRELRLERLFGQRFPGAKVNKVETSPLDDLSTPVWIRIDLSVPDYLDDTGDGLRLPTLRDLFGTVGEIATTATREQRAHELLLGSPSRSELTLEIELPPGFEVSNVPKSFRSKIPQIDFEFSAESQGRTIKVTRKLERLDPRVPVEDYAAYRDLVERVSQLASEQIVIRKIGEVD